MCDTLKSLGKKLHEGLYTDLDGNGERFVALDLIHHTRRLPAAPGRPSGLRRADCWSDDTSETGLSPRCSPPPSSTR